MTTQEENITIRLTPPDIPKMSWLIQKCSGEVSKDEVLTTITDLDMFIEILEDNHDVLMAHKKALLKRAISENIREDANAYLVEMPGKLVRNPIADIQKFKETFREGYHVIRDSQKRDLQDTYQRDIDNLEVSSIPLTLADKKVGKDLVTQFTGFKPQEIKVVVQRKQGTRKELLG